MDFKNIVLLNAAGNLYWKDKTGKYLGCNLSYTKVARLKNPEDIKGKSDYDLFSDLLSKEELDEIHEMDMLVLSHGKELTREELGVDEKGNKAVYLSKKIPILDEQGGVIGIIGNSLNITEMKNLMVAAEKANRLKQEFIENMQHDIRTPISGIFSLLDSLNKSGDVEEFKIYLPHLLNAARELLDIHNAVIDFESQDYGEKPIYSRKFSLFELLYSAIHLNSAAVLAHESTLTLKIDDDVPDVVKGDNYRISKILINLIANAIKFTEKGKVILRVTLINQKKERSTIRFSVEDTGIGIPEEEIPQIFEKFTRLNPSNIGKFKGSGLGLHMVKKFVDDIGAELDVKSIVNEGTIFTIDVKLELPLAQQLAGEKTHRELPRTLIIDAKETEKVEAIPTNTEILSTEKPLTIAMQETNVIRICLIEDSPIAMIAAENVLKKLNHACHIEKAANIADALDVLGQHQFDLVICDLGLPDGSGFDIIERVKKIKDHVNHETAFVALTAHSDDARQQRAKNLGFLGFYNKPLTEDMAKKMLADHVQARALEAVVDIASMTSVFGGNEESALEIINALVVSFKREEMILFSDAFNHNDYTRARELFHKFKGGISYIIAPELNKLTLALHDDVKVFERENKPLTDLMPQLEALFKAVNDIENWLNTYKAS